MGVNPIYIVGVFSPGGAYSEADFNEAMTGVSASQSLQGWADFFARNRRLAQRSAYGNRRQNGFSRLHLFIDQRFESEMTSYAQAAHPQLTTAAQVIDHLENSHHSWVGLI